MKISALSAVTSLRLMSKTPVRSLADLKGMGIKTGRDLIAPLKHYDTEGVIIPSVECFLLSILSWQLNARMSRNLIPVLIPFDVFHRCQPPEPAFFFGFL